VHWIGWILAEQMIHEGTFSELETVGFVDQCK
jgi:hypothetical protein